MVVTEYKYVVIDEKNVPVIKDANMKVVELVTSKIAYGWSPEEMHLQYPHLSLAQIYSALSYYSDHQEEIETDIKKRYDKVEELRKKLPQSPVLEKLRELKKLGKNECL